LDFRNWPFFSCGLCRHATLLPHTKYKLSVKSDNRLSYKRFSTLPLSAILNFKKQIIFAHVTIIEFNICCRTPNCIEIGRLFIEVWRFNDFQMAAIRHLVFVVTSQYCTVIHFRCPNIVLKFHVDRFFSFRDTGNIICWPFGCTMYITKHGNLEVVHALYHETLSRGGGSKINTRMKFLTPICLFTMPPLCVSDDD